jgi:hypothetical protein
MPERKLSTLIPANCVFANVKSTVDSKHISNCRNFKSSINGEMSAPSIGFISHLLLPIS